MIKCSKRPILLLEVMIAIALIVMAAIPLIYPHLYLLKTQRYFMDKVELDHVVNLHFVDVMEKLYNNQISWAAILNELDFPITEEDLEGYSGNKRFPFKGNYRFKVDIYKPKGEGGSALTLYLLNLDYVFTPVNQSPKEENQLKYHYQLFVVRDIGDGQLPQGDDDGGIEDDEDAP